MKLLMIGGTVFLGRHIVEAALAAGHDVTLFNRGRHNADLFPGVEKIRGDRDGGLEALGDGRWDAVIDTCGYFPRIVRASASHLADRVGHYTFISSVSVYADESIRGQDETAAVGRIDDPTIEEITEESYGPLKALCEEAVEEELPGRALVIRPGLIVGPYDPSDRFTYWPMRIHHGGRMLLPDLDDIPVEYIDVRDLAAWTLSTTERQATGVFNATGPEGGQTFGRFIEGCAASLPSNVEFVRISTSFIEAHGISYWSELPMCLPEELLGMNDVNCDRAYAAGLACRPLKETVRDTVAWRAPELAERPMRAGLAPEREETLLEAHIST
jgi:2'-hydroxyisoflavone reductase